MRLIAAILALSALWTHIGTRYVAELFDRPERAWEHLQYISRGFDHLIAYGVIVYLVGRVWPNSWDRWWLGVVCVAGAFFQLMIGVCGIGYWTLGGADNGLVGLCYSVQGWGPVALVSAAVILVVADTALHTRSR